MFPFYWALQDPKLGRFKTDFLLLGVDGELILLESSGEKIAHISKRWKGTSRIQSNTA